VSEAGKAVSNKVLAVTETNSLKSAIKEKCS